MPVAFLDAVTGDDQEAAGEAVVADVQAADAANDNYLDACFVGGIVTAGDQDGAVVAGGVAAGEMGGEALWLMSVLVCYGLSDCPLDCPSEHADLLSNSDCHETVHEVLLQKVRLLDGDLIGPDGRRMMEEAPAPSVGVQTAWMQCGDWPHPPADLAQLQAKRAQRVSEPHLERASDQCMRCDPYKEPGC